MVKPVCLRKKTLDEMLKQFSACNLADSLLYIKGIKIKYMLPTTTRFKSTAVMALCSFLLFSSLQSSAQKSVYEVIPGSGPKKETSTAPGVIRGTGNTTHRVYKVRRKSLPPGQAKKIYGGSATDYAPEQVKKGKHVHKHGVKGKWHKKHYKKAS